MKRALAVLVLAILADPAFGERRDAAELFAKIPRSPLIHIYPNEAWRRLVSLEKAGTKTLSPEGYAAAERDLAAAIEHARRLEAEPVYREVCALVERVRLDPAFGGIETTVHWEAPFVVFVEKGSGEKASSGRRSSRPIPAPSAGSAGSRRGSRSCSRRASPRARAGSRS